MEENVFDQTGEVIHRHMTTLKKFLDCVFFKNHFKIIAIDLSKQQVSILF